eukprot:COSAG01_NODE_36902_length_511_cov_0.873786_1_plen_36_part_10
MVHGTHPLDLKRREVVCEGEGVEDEELERDAVGLVR